MLIRIAILILLCLVALAYLQKDTFYVDANDVIVYAAHLPNLNMWVQDKWTQKNVGNEGIEIVMSHLATNRVPTRQVTENHDTMVVVLDPYYYELKWKKTLKLPELSQGPVGYFVALSSTPSSFKTECSYNLYGKKIAYMTESERLLIIAVLHAYRIPPSSVELVKINPADVLNLPDLLDKQFDMFVTYVVPNSLYFAMLRSLPVSLMGWQNIDMDRLRIYHPFITKTTNVDIKTTFATPSPRSLLMVMDREKDSHLLEMKMSMYLAFGPPPVETVKENFITRLAVDEELDDPAFQCYGDLSVAHKGVCNSKYDASGFPKTQTTKWDRPCFQDNECPFYKANKNYTNERGGCVRGKCELPLGVYRQSYRHFSEKFPYTPLCYQCTGPNCCEDQKNQEKYPNLKSPDYAFKGDKDDRIRAKLPYFVSI